MCLIREDYYISLGTTSTFSSWTSFWFGIFDRNTLFDASRVLLFFRKVNTEQYTYSEPDPRMLAMFRFKRAVQ